MKQIKLNEYWTVGPDRFESLQDAERSSLSVPIVRHGAQKDFVNNESRYSAYIGGVGSGKTFAGLARGLKFSQQPPAGGLYGPRGCVAAINYPVLQDVVLPQFFELMDGTNLWKGGGFDTGFSKSEKKARLVTACGCADPVTCKHASEILFRSLDKPNWMRGLELSWFFIDEGRHLTRGAWDVLIGRLRQKGYAHAGWVCSTPNGYDWMWELFHSESPDKSAAAVWFGAPTFENADHLPTEYMDDLQTSYSGRFYEQEVLGNFVGIMSGAVYPYWDPSKHLLDDISYDPEWPLYSFWDFGIGDLGVVEWAQIKYEKVEVLDEITNRMIEEWMPSLYFLDAEEAKDRGAAEWADYYHDWLEHNVPIGTRPKINAGDPAGLQRAMSSGTSVIEALMAHGVPITPAPKKPQDYAIRILDNMMAADRVFADREHCVKLAAAIATHRWPTDDRGNRTGKIPVHDWTSHYSDAMRYGAALLLTHSPRRTEVPGREPPGPGTYGELFERAVRKPEQWLGPTADKPLSFQPSGVLSARRK